MKNEEVIENLIELKTLLKTVIERIESLEKKIDIKETEIKDIDKRTLTLEVKNKVNKNNIAIFISMGSFIFSVLIVLKTFNII